MQKFFRWLGSQYLLTFEAFFGFLGQEISNKILRRQWHKWKIRMYLFFYKSWIIQNKRLNCGTSVWCDGVGSNTFGKTVCICHILYCICMLFAGPYGWSGSGFITTSILGSLIQVLSICLWSIKGSGSSTHLSH